MPLLKKLRLVAVIQEAALGTGLTGAIADFEAWDVKYTPSIEYIERGDLGSLSPPPGHTGQATGQVTFKTYFRGSASVGTPALYLERLFPMVNYAQVLQVFSPSGLAPAAGGPTAVVPITGTISSYEAGLKKTISGAMGSAKLIMTAGQPIVMEWTFSGRYEGIAAAVPVIDATLVAQTLSEAAGAAMKFSEATISFTGGTLGCIESMTLDLGNQVTVRPCASEKTGMGYAAITGRKVTGTMNPESALTTTAANYLGWQNDTDAALSIAVAGGGTTCTITAPVCRRTNIQDGERNGIQTDEIDFMCHKSATVGNDELIFTFT